MSNDNYGQGSSNGSENEAALTFFEQALAFEKCGNFNGAIAAFGEAIHRDPENPDYYFGRGGVFGQTGNYDLAIQDFDHAIALKPDFAWAYAARGAVYGETGNRDKEAINDLSCAISLKPDLSHAYIALDKISPRLIGKRDRCAPLSKKILYSILVVFTLGIACVPFSRIPWVPCKDRNGDFSFPIFFINIILIIFKHTAPYIVCGFVYHIFRLLFLLCLGIVILIKQMLGSNGSEAKTDTSNT